MNPTRPKIGFIWLPRSAREAVEIARRAEAGGFWGLGISDSPVLYQEMYPVISACLQATDRLVVGSNVTNPVTRHWTIHASTHRTYDELHPGRYYLGIASGDGAVHSIGRRPATLAELQASVEEIRRAVPSPARIQVAASGPKAARVAGRVADAVILGVGADPGAIELLRARVQQGAEEAGRPVPEIWALVPTYIVEDDVTRAEARAAYAAIAVAYARFALDVTFAEKNVPEELQADLRRGLDRYDFGHHASVGAPNPNARVFDDAPHVLEYLLDRMVLVGNREHCEARLAWFLEESGVDGVHLTVIAPDPVDVVGRASDAFSTLV